MLMLTSYLFLLLLKKKKQRDNKRRWWVRPINANRKNQGHYHNLVAEMRLSDTESFFRFTRMTCEHFDELVGLLFEKLRKKSIRPALEPAQRLMITLRYLATGETHQSLAFSFRVGRSTVSSVVKETCSILWEMLQPIYLKPPDKEDWRSIAKKIEQRWNFPHCLGAIDGKHVRCVAPINSGSQYFNYKKYFSIVLLAVCDAEYKFILVDIGGYGSENDRGIFAASHFGQCLKKKLLDMPDEEMLEDNSIKLPYFFVGDEAFPLRTDLMRPYSSRVTGGLQEQQNVFNYRLSRARRTIENTFGILAARWRIFHTAIGTMPDNVDTIIQATVCLHKKCQQYCPPNYPDRDENGTFYPGEWRNEATSTSAIQDTFKMGSNNRALRAVTIRDQLKDYFNSNEGSLSWQLQHVRRGKQ